jgi:hypothetical protein
MRKPKLARRTSSVGVYEHSPEREICSKARAFENFEMIEKCDGFSVRVEGDGEQTTIPTIGGTEVLVENPRSVVLRVVNVFH